MLKSLLLSSLFLVSFFSFAQTPFNPDTEPDFVKATYAGGNLISILSQDLSYSKEAALNGTEGYVTFLLVIDENGKLVSVTPKDRVSDLLANPAKAAIDKLTANWKPSKVGGRPVEREYLLVFSYKIFYNALPLDYHAMAKKYEEKGKLEKAVKTYDDAIKEYPYDPVYYTMRAKYKSELGDADGARADALMAQKINMEVLAVVQIAHTQSVR
ncbi:energy transducer TonB [Algoriphagus sp.]|uniref:energy transducer TonB n=1 Tax=Algoriphagus sp. TaxID=1872435 RepID=UPI00326C1AD8